MIVDINAIKDIVKSAKPLFMDRHGSTDITEKGVANYVTQVDMNVQNYLQKELKKVYPDILFMSEEKDNSDVDFSGHVWILDPVDGTTNLIHDFHGSSISLGLSYNCEIIMGVIYIPTSDELFYAEKGKGAFLDGERIYCSTERDFGKALIGIGSSPYKKEWADLNFDTFKKIFKDASDVRRIGSAAIELAYVASGRMDAYIEASLNAWDYSAGKLIVEEAGGKVVSFDGEDLEIPKAGSMCASNGYIGDILVKSYLPSEDAYIR